MKQSFTDFFLHLVINLNYSHTTTVTVHSCEIKLINKSLNNTVCVTAIIIKLNLVNPCAGVLFLRNRNVFGNCAK